MKAIEHPLSFTPTFSGLPDGDKLRKAYDYKLRKAYDYKLKEAEARLKEQREEQNSRDAH